MGLRRVIDLAREDAGGAIADRPNKEGVKCLTTTGVTCGNSSLIS